MPDKNANWTSGYPLPRDRWTDFLSGLGAGTVTTGLGYALTTVHKPQLIQLVEATPMGELKHISHGMLGVAAPIAAALILTYPLSFGLHALRYYCTSKGHWPTGAAWTEIRRNARNDAFKVGAGFLGMEFMHQLFDKTVLHKAVAQTVGNMTHAYPSGDIATKGVLALIAGLGFGFGMVAAVMAGNALDKKSTPISHCLAAFAVGTAIGAASVIGYGHRVAAYLAPLLVTVGLFSILPRVTDYTEKTGVSMTRLYTKYNCFASEIEVDEEEVEDLYKDNNLSKVGV
jgi:hypothetical protein